MTNPIEQSVINKTSFIQQGLGTATTELETGQFLGQVLGILETGIQQNYSTEFMTDQLYELVQKNPNLVGELKFPADYLSIKLDVVGPWKLATIQNAEEKNTLVLNREADRKKSILENTPAIFEVADNPKADRSKPLIEKHAKSQVGKYDNLIEKEAEAQNVDPDLVRAIMYMETTHGWYDKPLDLVGMNKSILPMNVHVEYWEKLGYSRKDLEDPEKNLRTGVLLIKRISERIKDPTVEKIASVYQFLGSEQVSDYGARVGEIYRNKLWQQNGNMS